MWFLGDDFMTRSFTQYFMNAFGENGKTGYVRAHYDVTGFSSVQNLNTSLISRLRNSIVEAINKQTTFPKAIVIVLENDLINDTKHLKPGFSTIVGKLLEWIANQLHRIIIAHKEKLPSKCRKFKYPTILWVALPNHTEWGSLNEFRVKYNNSLQSVVSLFREMEELQLEDWDYGDLSLFTWRNLNAKGLATYWQQVDAAIEKWDKQQMRQMHHPTRPRNSTYREDSSRQGRFQWKPDTTRYRLPPPH